MSATVPAEILSPVKISDCELLKAPVQSSFCRFWNFLMGGGSLHLCQAEKAPMSRSNRFFGVGKRAPGSEQKYATDLG